MAKFRPPRGKKHQATSSARSAIPCLLLLVTGMIIIFLLFWALLRSWSPS
jgi:hypothetical protein